MLNVEGVKKLTETLQNAHTESSVLNDYACLISEQLPQHCKLAEDDLAQIVAFSALGIKDNLDEYEVVHPILTDFINDGGSVCALSANLPRAILSTATDEVIIKFAENYKEISLKFFGEPSETP